MYVGIQKEYSCIKITKRQKGGGRSSRNSSEAKKRERKRKAPFSPFSWCRLIIGVLRSYLYLR